MRVILLNGNDAIPFIAARLYKQATAVSGYLTVRRVHETRVLPRSNNTIKKNWRYYDKPEPNSNGLGENYSGNKERHFYQPEGGGFTNLQKPGTGGGRVNRGTVTAVRHQGSSSRSFSGLSASPFFISVIVVDFVVGRHRHYYVEHQHRYKTKCHGCLRAAPFLLFLGTLLAKAFSGPLYIWLATTNRPFPGWFPLAAGTRELALKDPGENR